KLAERYRNAEKYIRRESNGNGMYGQALTLFLSFWSSEVPFKKVEGDKSSAPLNLIMYGPPGTGKTFHAISRSLKALGEKTETLTRKQIKEKYDRYVTDRRIVFTTF